MASSFVNDVMVEDYDDGIWNASRPPEFIINPNADEIMDFIEPIDPYNFQRNVYESSDNITPLQSDSESMHNFDHYDDDKRDQFDTAYNVDDDKRESNIDELKNLVTSKDYMFEEWWSKLDVRSSVSQFKSVSVPVFSWFKKPRSIRKSTKMSALIAFMVICVMLQAHFLVCFISTLHFFVKSNPDFKRHENTWNQQKVTFSTASQRKSNFLLTSGTRDRQNYLLSSLFPCSGNLHNFPNKEPTKLFCTEPSTAVLLHGKSGIDKGTKISDTEEATKTQNMKSMKTCRYSENDIFFAFLTDNRLFKNSYKRYCESVISSIGYRWNRLKLFLKANRVSKTVFQSIRKRYDNDNFNDLDPYIKTMFMTINNKRWPKIRVICFRKSQNIGYPPVKEQLDEALLIDLLAVNTLLSKHFTTLVEDNIDWRYVMEMLVSESKVLQSVSNLYTKILDHFFYSVIDNADKQCKVYRPRLKPRKVEEESRSQYKPRIEDKPRKQYKPRIEDKPRKQYKPRTEDKPRKQYKLRTEDRPRKQYEPRTEDKPRKQYNPRTEPTKQRADKGVKRKNTINSSINSNEIKDINFDAKYYSDKYNAASCFEVCCVCGHEDSQNNMREKSNYDMTKLNDLWRLKLETDSNTSSQENAFINDLKDNLPEGVLPTTTKVCINCTKHLNSKLKKSNPKGIPPNALLNGLYQGTVPAELKGLNDVEISMISIYSCVTRLKVNPNNDKHHRRFATTFTIINDLVEVNQILPRVLTIEDFALLRHRTNKGIKHYKFRPYKVREALDWLKKNNPLYKDYVFIWETEASNTNSICKDYVTIDWENKNGPTYDPPFIELTDEDNDSLNHELENSIATTTTGEIAHLELQQEKQVLLMAPDDINTHEETLKQVVNSNLRYIFERPKTDFEFVTPFSNPDFFWAKAFPCLFPYGKGCPNDPANPSSLNDIGKFTKHVLQRGGGPQARRFQQCPSYYFAVYHYVLRNKIRGISYLAQNSIYDDVNDTSHDLSVESLAQILNDLQQDVTIDNELLSSINDTLQENENHADENTVSNHTFNSDDINTKSSDTNASTKSNIPQKTMSKEEIKHSLKRLSVYSKNLKGTSLYMQNERCKLMAMLASPDIASEGIWRWFLTITPNDIYDSKLYELVGLDDDHDLTWNNEQRADLARQMTEEQRKKRLAQHPALTARLFDIKLRCIFDCILLGKDKPLGEIVDYFKRIEFQLRGSPHAHCLLCIKRDEILESFVHSKNPEEQQKVLDLISKTVTAILENPPDGVINNEEKEFDFNCTSTYFNDSEDPRRLPLDPTLDYSRDEYGNLQGEVYTRYRNNQLASQMHRCTRSCFKYCIKGQPMECRSNFPYDPEGPTNPKTPVIHAYHDSKCRRQIKVYPERNNANLNSTVKSPLLALAIAGNHDLQYISNQIGAAEYVASYATKHDLPDFKLISNFLYKRLQRAFTDQKRLQAVATSVIDSTTVGSVEAIYLLLGLDLVEKSRDVDNINPLHRNRIKKAIETDTEILNEMNAEDKPYKLGIKSHLGKRQAYETLMKQQRETFNQCHITLYTLLVNFTIDNYSATSHADSSFELPPLLMIDEFGKVTNGLIGFRINNLIFKKREKNAVLNPCPYIPVNKLSDVSCYATLLLHVPWPLEGESKITCDLLSALQENKLLPSYVIPLLERVEKSQNLFVNAANQDDAKKYQSNDDNDDDDDEIIYCQHENLHEIFNDENWEREVTFESTNGIVANINRKDMTYFQNVVPNLLLQKKTEIIRLNKIQANEERSYVFNKVSVPKIFNLYKPTKLKICPYDDHENRIHKLNDSYALLNEKQRQAIDTICNALTNEDKCNSQLQMFLTGEGGTGKSKVIELAIEFAKLYFGKQEGNYGPALAMAATGTAGKNIGGFTWQSVLNKHNSNELWNDVKAQDVGAKIKGVQFIILDEISLLSFETLLEIHTRIIGGLLATIPNTTEENKRKRYEISLKPFGGLHVLFCGDLYQLKCVKGTPLYIPRNMIKTSKANLGSDLWYNISTYVELTENMRMSKPGVKLSDEDIAFIKFLSQARKGDVNANGFQKFLNQINTTKLVDFENQAADKADPNALWIANEIAEADKMNNRQFDQLKSSGNAAVRIIAHHTPTSTNIPMPTNEQSKLLYALTPDRNKTVKTPTYIDLCIGSNVMLTRNIATEIGLTNGTMGKVVAFGFSDKSSTMTFLSFKDFYTYDSNKTPPPIVFVQFNSIPIKTKDIFIDGKKFEKVIPITVTKDEYRRLKIDNVKYYRWQLPLIPAAALNTHKVQGLTAENGIVYKPTYNGRHWARALEYVAISRCTSISGNKLVLLKPLKLDHFTSPPKEYKWIDEAYKYFINLNVNMTISS